MHRGKVKGAAVLALGLPDVGKVRFVSGEPPSVPATVLASLLFPGAATLSPRSRTRVWLYLRGGPSQAVLVDRNHCYDNDGHPKDAGSRRRNEPVRPEDVRPIKIGDDVWIGTGAIVLKGVSIGDRAIVGAGAVVVRDVQPDTVVAGNPARLIRTLTEQLPDRAR